MLQLGHCPAFLRAIAASLRALLAVFVLVFLALGGAGIADRRAQGTHFFCAAAAASHDSGCKAADVRTVHVVPDTFRHLSDVRFRKAGSCTMIASGSAGVTGLYARLMLLVCHVVPSMERG